MTDQQFDVFLAHSSKDKPLIRRIYQELRTRGIQPWLDEEDIAPGSNFHAEIQSAIGQAKTAAICIGQEDLGQWQELEARAFISLFISKSARVIPVLLPGVDQIPDSQILLSQFQFVRFGETIQNQQAFDRLEWGITGKKPESLGAESFEDISPEAKPSSFQEYNPAKILFIKNVKDPSGRWAYRLEGVKSDLEPIFELMWRLSSHGVALPKTGDLMILHQQAKVTHVVEFLDEEVRETEFGFMRWVKAAWMPKQSNWLQLPHQRETLGFSPKYSDGNTHALQSPNFSTFHGAWSCISDFQLHLMKRLRELDDMKSK